MSKAARVLIPLLLIVGLGAAAGLYFYYNPLEAQRPPLPPEFQAKLRQAEAAEKVMKGLLALEELRLLADAEPAEAARRIRAFIEAAPKSPEASEARLILAGILAKTGDTPGALAALAEVIADPTAGPRASRALIERARLLGKADPAAARRDLEAILHDDAHLPAYHNQARLELGLLEVRTGKFLQAIATLTPLTLKNYPEKPGAFEAIRQALAGHADVLAASENPAALLAWADEMTRKFPDLEPMRNALLFHQAGALRKSGRLTEARTVAERLRRDDPALEAACASELTRIAEAEAAAGIIRAPAAFLAAKAQGKETRAHTQGDIAADTTWAKANAPLVLTGKTTIKPGATLTIEPGFTVQFFLGAQLVVEGTLIARGTPEEPIRFTSAVQKAPTPFDGDGILFAASSDAARCVLEHCLVEHQRIGVACAGASPTLRRTTLARNGVAGLMATDGARPRIEALCHIEDNDSAGIRISGAQPSIRQAIIRRNGADGIRLTDKATATIEACRIRDNRGHGVALDNFAGGTIQGNEIAANHRCGIHANRFSQPAIRANAIRENHSTGIRCAMQSTANITANLIEANRDHPIILEKSDGVIQGNIITRNRPYGLNCLSESSPRIEGNWIEANGGAGILCGEASSPLITRNAILGQGKAISNASALTIQARDNFFGNADDAKMDELIFDKADEQTLGEIVWRPRLTAPPPKPPMPPLDGLPPLD